MYVGSFDGRVYAVDAAIGGERWRFDTGNVVFSSPKVAGGTVYVGSHSGRDVRARRRRWRIVDWRFATGAIVGATASVDDDARLLRLRRRQPLRRRTLSRRVAAQSRGRAHVSSQ